MNCVQIVGRVGQDPDYKQGVTYCIAILSVATNERGYTLQNGTQVPDRTDWHRVRVFGKTADFAHKYVKKGCLVSVVGSLHYEKYEDRQGVTMEKAIVRADELRLLISKDEGNNQPQQKPNEVGRQQQCAVNDGLPFEL